MSTTIDGWVEVYDEASKLWFAVIDVGAIVGCCYDAYARLFGVRNDGGWTPIAAGRGLLSDVSPCAHDAYALGYLHDPSWITWQELQAIDWTERSQAMAVHTARRTLQGLVWYGRRYGAQAPPGDAREESPGVYTWSAGEEVHTLRTMTRAEAVADDGWPLLFTLMDALASRYRPPYVRLVVWFVT